MDKDLHEHLGTVLGASGRVDASKLHEHLRSRWLGFGYDEESMRFKAIELASDINYLLFGRSYTEAMFPQTAGTGLGK